MFHHSLNLTGVTETTPVGSPSRIWNYTTGNSVTSSPAVADGMLFVGSDDGKVYCLNASTGAQIWNCTTGGKVESSPAVADGMVYVGSDDSNVYCLNESTGAQIWYYTTTTNTVYSPVVANGMVYVASGGILYCLNATTKAPFIWIFTNGPSFRSAPAVADGMVFVANYNNKVYCLNASTGGTIRTYSVAGNIWASSPAVADGMLFIGSTDYKVYCFNVSTGVQKWSCPTGYYVESSPAVANGMVYVGSCDNKIYCINESTGVENWNYTTSDIVLSSPAVANGMVYVGSCDNNTYCLNASTGTKIWNFTTGNQIVSSPAIANGMVYIGSEDDNVYCLPMIFCSIPSAPLNPTAISGSGQVSLSWSAPSDNGGSPITYYNIYRCTSSGSETFLTSVNATSTQYIDTEVTDGLTYYYNVSAINLAGEGPQSNEVNAIPTGVPSIPLNLQITPGNNKITLAWHIPSNNGGLTITGYNIYRGTSSGTEVILTTVNGSTLTYMDTGLTANTTYYYQISAINSAGVGQKSSEIHATTLTPNSKNTIGGMVIESLLLVSCISMIVIVLGVKKHIKK